MTEKTKQAEETVAPEATTPVQDPVTELTINDLNALKQIIDVASGRGAFKPNEMMTVGQTYGKLEAFLNAVNVAQQAKPEQPKGE